LFAASVIRACLNASLGITLGCLSLRKIAFHHSAVVIDIQDIRQFLFILEKDVMPAALGLSNCNLAVWVLFSNLNKPKKQIFCHEGKL